MNNRPFVIGIAGGSGSGKTFFLKCFLHHFATRQISLVSQDDYYKPMGTQPKDANGWINFDLPECIDDEKLFADLTLLLSGETVYKKEYTFNTAEESAKTLTINSAPILIVEGLFIFHFQKIASLFDMKIFMDANEEITLNRRLKRDIAERGYDHGMIMYQWVNHVLPAYNAYLLPYKNSADKIIMNNTHVADDIIEVTKCLADELKANLLLDY